MAISMLSDEALFSSLASSQRRGLLEDESPHTAMERGDGILPAIQVKKARAGLATVEELAAVFDQCVGPASLEASTRAGYQAAWRTVLTWGIAREAVGKLLPMGKQTLKGRCWTWLASRPARNRRSWYASCGLRRCAG
jgi:hypothetical protein